MNLAGLALHERAALLGITCREYVQLAESDPRIVGDAALATPAAIARLQAWFRSGMPAADMTRLVFRGPSADGVHRDLMATITTLPMLAQCLATTVLWVSIGGGRVAGWMATVPAGATQVIALDAAAPADLMPSIVAHELAHALHADSDPVPAQERPRVTASERAAFQLVSATLRGETVETAARRFYRDEVLANETAALWGYPSSRIVADSVRLEDLRNNLLAARSRAAEIMTELELPVAACEIERGE